MASSFFLGLKPPGSMPAPFQGKDFAFDGHIPFLKLKSGVGHEKLYIQEREEFSTMNFKDELQQVGRLFAKEEYTASATRGVVVIDLEHRLILHPVSIAGAVLAAIFGVWKHGWVETLIGGAAGFGMMWLLYLFGELFAKWMARRRGGLANEVALGFGDVNLAGVLGLLLGWPGIVLGLFLTILLGGVVSLLYILLFVC